MEKTEQKKQKMPEQSKRKMCSKRKIPDQKKEQRKRKCVTPLPIAPKPQETAIDVVNTWLLVFMKTMSPATKEYCRQQFWWKTAINVMDSPERYKCLLCRALNDGNLTKGQQQALELYTREVCAEHLPIATAVWTLYTKNVTL